MWSKLSFLSSATSRNHPRGLQEHKTQRQERRVAQFIDKIRARRRRRYSVVPACRLHGGAVTDCENLSRTTTMMMEKCHFLLKPQDDTGGAALSAQRFKDCVHTAGPTESDCETSFLDFPPTLNDTSKEIKIGGGTKNTFDTDSPTKGRRRRGGCVCADWTSEVCELINVFYSHNLPK